MFPLTMCSSSCVCNQNLVQWNLVKNTDLRKPSYLEQGNFRGPKEIIITRFHCMLKPLRCCLNPKQDYVQSSLVPNAWANQMSEKSALVQDHVFMPTRWRNFYSQTGVPFTPWKRLASSPHVSNLVFFKWGCKSKFNLLWQKIVSCARFRTPNLSIQRPVLYQYATNKALEAVVFWRNKA